MPPAPRLPALFVGHGAEPYLPLRYAGGARLPDDAVQVFNDTIDAALSMTSYLIRAPVPLA